MRKILLWVTLAGCCLACTRPENIAGPEGFLNLDSLVYAQEKFSADFIKKVSLDGKIGDSVIQSPGDWKAQLSFLQRLEVMKKPVYRKSYSTSLKKDSLSNLWVKTWESSDSTAPVRFLKIYFVEQPYKAIRMIADVREKNILFSKSEHYVLHFDAFRPRVDRFQITGTQKVIWMDPRSYAIDVSVRYTR